ncbi:MAG TPA: carboxypeptidase regulatory-like domain-containing protein [Pyrinomonadaceae bacterium]|nr:carboxypeptidase regulatory-like domain-containing protein [Pyrinomonadaceae bacterium]
MVNRSLRSHVPHWLQLCVLSFLLCCAQSLAQAQTPQPILVSAPDSTRAVALETVGQTPEPFTPIATSFLYGSDKVTRVTVFAMNLSLKAGDDATSLTADAEDAQHRHYNLTVEYVGKVPDQEWLTQVSLRLSEQMGDVGDVLLKITYQGVSSNRVRIGIGHIGGGPPDDPGAVPTPTTPYTISGRITSGTAGLDGVTVTLGGSQHGTMTTNESGNYSFAVTVGGSYTVTPSKKFYVFTPASYTFSNLSGDRTAGFNAALMNFTISGTLKDEQGNGLAGWSVTLKSSAGDSATRVLTTTTGGAFAFADVPAGFNYTITPSGTSIYAFTSQGINALEQNQVLAFQATRQRYNITGIVKDDQGKPLVDLPVTLKSSIGPSWMMEVRTGTGGVYTFADVPAGFNYTVTPSNTPLYGFTSQSVNVLDKEQVLNFQAKLNSYSISGVVLTPEGQSASGVSVFLSGPSSLFTTTDANGKYSFSNLPAGKDYYVSTGKTDYIFSPESRALNFLLEDERADFTAIRLYHLSGRVADQSGKGLAFARVTLSGPETGVAVTDMDGYYSFTVRTKGDYLITPSRVQDYFQFAPANRSFVNLSDNQITNFIGTLSINGPTQVLEFDGSAMMVDYGIFWPQDSPVGHFFWEFWAMPGDETYGRYLISDGYGGSHTILFGFNPGPRGYSLFGNVWDGSKVNYFQSDEGPSPKEWGHYAVGWDGKSIITYYNGVPVGKQPFTGPRVAMGTGWGSSMLLIGGSNHQNLIGRIAQVRGYEENNPRESSPESSFAPQTVFSREGQLLSYYFRQAETVADLSAGYNGSLHDGWPRGFQEFYFNYSCAGCPIPNFVHDPTAPDFSNPSNPGHVTTLIQSPPATPGDARVFDSFSRDNSTYILGGKGGLGTTETGTDGQKTWQTNAGTTEPQPFGILGGRAVLLADDKALAWISTGSGTGNLDVRVERTAGSFGSGVNTGLSFRVVDKDNFFFAYTSDDEVNASGPKKLTVGYYQAGVRTILTSGVAVSPANWKTLRVSTTASGSISVYTDASLIYSTTSTIFATATGAGLFNNGPGLALTNRWDNFTVLDVP